MIGAAKRVFCFGLGYVAGHLAAAGRGIAGTRRTERSVAAMAERGIEAHVFAGDRPMASGGEALSGATHLLASIPPGDDGDPALVHHGRDIAAASALEWIGYLSTTGVYGDRDGGWVDETTAPDPATEPALRRLTVEGAWLKLGAMNGIPVHIFRLAGIYGPGRNALERLRAGSARRIVKPGQVFSRIHVADILGVLLASMERPRSGAIYNVCDDEPAAQPVVIAHAAGLLGIEPPAAEPFETADLSPAAQRFYSENRRVCNRRIKQELGVALRYPSYREGLAALVDQPRHLNPLVKPPADDDLATITHSNISIS